MATNELYGSCLEDMMVLMTGVVCTTDNDSFVNTICPLHGAKYKLNNIM